MEPGQNLQRLEREGEVRRRSAGFQFCGMHHAIDVSDLTGTRMLKHVLDQSGTSASQLARLLKVHASMGSKILKGERRLTWEHAKTLANHFRIAPALFMD